MLPSNLDPASTAYSVLNPAPHDLHRCASPVEFVDRFVAASGSGMDSIGSGIIHDTQPRAVFLVGSIPLGMATSGSDIDLFVLIDDRDALVARDQQSNSDQILEFSNAEDPLLAGMSATLHNGILVDVHFVLSEGIRAIGSRLRLRGPELSEPEIRTLGRLGTGWLLWQTDDYLKRSGLNLNDPTFAVYCCTKSFVSALIQRRKAVHTLAQSDIPVTLQLGRSSVEAAYLAYFASEGLTYLGSKWLAQIGCARGAPERLQRHPVLKEGIELLFPSVSSSVADVADYLKNVRAFHASVQTLIEQKVLFRIAFKACAQIQAAKE
jgi:hypothetical protein